MIIIGRAKRLLFIRIFRNASSSFAAFSSDMTFASTLLVTYSLKMLSIIPSPRLSFGMYIFVSPEISEDVTELSSAAFADVFSAVTADVSDETVVSFPISALLPEHPVSIAAAQSMGTILIFLFIIESSYFMLELAYIFGFS